MSILITEAKILDTQSPYNRKKVNILIKDGKIAYIGENKHKAEKTISAKGAILTPGWMDLQANFGDPGNEHKEDLTTGRKVAMAGGFTEVVVLPNTHPVIQRKNDILFKEGISAGGNISRVVVSMEDHNNSGNSLYKTDRLRIRGNKNFRYRHPLKFFGQWCAGCNLPASFTL